jgi:hypothetical protein
MDTDDCVHYWVIDSPDGKTSWGQCTACLERREFPNAIGDQGWDWPAINSLDWEARQQRGVSTHPLSMSLHERDGPVWAD